LNYIPRLILDHRGPVLQGIAVAGYKPENHLAYIRSNGFISEVCFFFYSIRPSKGRVLFVNIEYPRRGAARSGLWIVTGIFKSGCRRRFGIISCRRVMGIPVANREVGDAQIESVLAFRIKKIRRECVGRLRVCRVQHCLVYGKVH